METTSDFMELIKQIWYFDLLHFENMTLRVYHLFGVLLVILMTRLVLYFTNKIVRRQIDKKHLDQGRTLALYQIFKYIIVLTAIFIGFDVVGIQLTLLLGGAAALLVGVGLGLQTTFNDIISGIVILFERSVAIGDILEVDKILGRVVDISIRTSEIETFDNISLIIPNSKIVGESVINWTHNRQSTRFTITVGVSYGSDVRLVEKLLYEVAKEHPEVDQARASEVFFQDFGDSALIFDLKFYSNTLSSLMKVRSDLRFAIEDKFNKNKVVIAYPQRDIHIKSMVNMKNFDV